MLPEDCTNREGEILGENWEPETGRYSDEVHGPNDDTYPVVSSNSTAKPYAATPDLVYREL